MSTYDRVYELTYNKLHSFFLGAKERQDYISMVGYAEVEAMAALIKHVEDGDLNKAQQIAAYMRALWAKEMADLEATKAAEYAEEDRMVMRGA